EILSASSVMTHAALEKTINFQGSGSSITSEGGRGRFFDPPRNLTPIIEQSVVSDEDSFKFASISLCCQHVALPQEQRFLTRKAIAFPERFSHFQWISNHDDIGRRVTRPP